MRYSDLSENIHIELDDENCELSEAQIGQMERALTPLRAPLEPFPVAHLYITVAYKHPSHDYRVKVALRLPGKGLATGDVDEEMYPAFRRCVRKLLAKVRAYQQHMDHSEEISKHEKGTHHDVIATRPVDWDEIDVAIRAQDYGRFRKLTLPFEESIRKRAGRWLQRYPEIEAQLGSRFDLADVVEEVFLNAFERIAEHPREVPFGDWLEGLIDPSIKLLYTDTDEELTNISFARSSLS